MVYIRSTVCRYKADWDEAEEVLKKHYRALGQSPLATWSNFKKGYQYPAYTVIPNSALTTSPSPLTNPMSTTMSAPAPAALMSSDMVKDSPNDCQPEAFTMESYSPLSSPPIAPVLNRELASDNSQPEAFPVESYSPLLSPPIAPALNRELASDNSMDLPTIPKVASPTLHQHTELCPFCDNPLPTLTEELRSELNSLIAQSVPAPHPKNPAHRQAKVIQFASFCESHRFPQMLAQAQSVGWPLSLDHSSLARWVILLKPVIWAFLLYPANTFLIEEAVRDSRPGRLGLEHSLNIIGAG